MSNIYSLTSGNNAGLNATCIGLSTTISANVITINTLNLYLTCYFLHQLRHNSVQKGLHRNLSVVLEQESYKLDAFPVI